MDAYELSVIFSHIGYMLLLLEFSFPNTLSQVYNCYIIWLVSGWYQVFNKAVWLWMIRHFFLLDTLLGMKFLPSFVCCYRLLCTYYRLFWLLKGVLQNSFFVDHLSFVKFSLRTSLELRYLPLFVFTIHTKAAAVKTSMSHLNRFCSLYRVVLYDHEILCIALQFICFWFNVCVITILSWEVLCISTI